jgi:hypothetical protein
MLISRANLKWQGRLRRLVQLWQIAEVDHVRQNVRLNLPLVLRISQS